MREIKFRAKNLARGHKWCYGSLITYPDGCADIHGLDIMRTGSGRIEFMQVNPETVGQFTEMKDKNGVEIYEGDILELVVTYQGKPVGEPRIRKVVWKDSGLCIVNKHNDCVCERSFTCQEVEYRVIGNIYDNPDIDI